jgi:zinc protease
VLFSAWSPGGTSLIADKDFTSASFASTVVTEGGVAQFDQISLQKLLTGKIVNVRPTLSELSEGFQGSASPADLETMFQLVYLYATAPRKDTTAFASWITRMRASLQNRSAMPEIAFDDTVNVTMAQHLDRRRPFTEEGLKEVNLQASFDIYKQRFADFGDFTFFFVGAFDFVKIEPLVKTYLASLPSLKRNEKWNDINVQTPIGKVEKSVKKGIEPKSLVRLMYTGPFEYTQQSRYDMQALASVLRIKLREVLREDKGGVYGVGVGAQPAHYPKSEYRMTISFGCAPDRVEELIKATIEQIDSIKNFVPDPSYIQKVKEQQRRERETNLKENRFWGASLVNLYTNDEDPFNFLKYEGLVEKLTPQAVQSAARKYFDNKNFAKFVLYPQESKAP